jgi:hypothetical protein
MKRRRTPIIKRRISTQKGLVTPLKKALEVVYIVIEKKLSLWQSKKTLMKKNGYK